MNRIRCRGALVRISGVTMATLIAASTVGAGTPPPRDLHQRVDFEQRLGVQVPMRTRFMDVDGRRVSLEKVAAGKPVLLSLGYYQCPNLCDVTLAAIAQGLARLDLRAGRDFEVVFIGIDPHERPADARRTRRTLGASQPEANVDRWRLLTGDAVSIGAVADAIGYRYVYDPGLGQYVHPAGLVVLDGSGRVSQYLFGVGYRRDTLRLAIVAASAGEVGNLIDHLVLLCSGYDPQTGRYSILVGRLLRWLGIASAVLLAGWVLHLHRTRRRGGERRA